MVQIGDGNAEWMVVVWQKAVLGMVRVIISGEKRGARERGGEGSGGGR